MLTGDLIADPLVPLLLDLAAESATGCLVITAPDGEPAEVFVSDGLIYAINVSGLRAQLGTKLVSSGALTPQALADALEAQRNDGQDWRLGELLVHLGYVEQPVVEAFVREQIQDALWDLVRWNEGDWQFRTDVNTRHDVAPPTPVIDLLTVLRQRGYEWQSIAAAVHGPNAVPALSSHGAAEPDTMLTNDAWSMLCKIDGQRTLAELASDGGYTLFEAGQIVVSLVHAGLVDIEEELGGDELYGAPMVAAALADPASSAARPDSHQESEATGNDPSSVALEHRGESFATAIARVSIALNAVLGPDTGPAEPADLVAVDLRTRHARERAASLATDPDGEREERLREAAAAELAAAQELAELARQEQESAQALSARMAAAHATAETEAAKQAAAATALLVELSNEAAPAQPDEADEEDPEPDEEEPESEAELEVPEPESELPAATDVPREMADTAALLRELTSLGVDDDRRSTPPAPSTPSRRPPVSRPAASAAARKKKRGLFGL